MDPKNEVTTEQKKESDFASVQYHQQVVHQLQVIKKRKKSRKWKGWYFC